MSGPLSEAEIELRMRCLALAVTCTKRGGDPVAFAESFRAFAEGESGLTPRQQIMAALERLGGADATP